MNNFTYYAPTKVVFGKDTHLLCGSLIREYAPGRVLVHYGGKSAAKSGLLDEIYASLEKEGIEYISLGGAVPNPRLGLVYEGIELCRKEGVDFILALGGGSAMDSAKAIACGVKYGGDVWDLYLRKEPVREALPLGVVVTIAATGSEMSNSSVITNENGSLKRSIKSDLVRPRFAVMNPALTCTLPLFQTMSGCVDIIMHTFERFFSREEDTQLTDTLALGLVKTVMHNAKILMKDPNNYNARAEILWAGSLSHNNLTGCGRAGDWACHQLEHELSGMFDVAHGAGLSAIWGSWARYVYKEEPLRFAKLAFEALNIPYDYENPENTALAAIEAMETFFSSIGMPVNISQLGIELTDENIKELAYKCSFMDTRTIGGLKILGRKDMEEIYRMAR